MRLDGIALWDGGEYRGPSTLVWSGDRIEAVDPAAHEERPELCVIPGLVDTHVHLVGYAGEGTADFATWPLVTTRDEQVRCARASPRFATWPPTTPRWRSAVCSTPGSCPAHACSRTAWSA
jgi:imidazolonepropionase-like amidohydrolase